MAKIDPVKVWSLQYRMMMSVISSVAPKVSELGLEVKELFVLSSVDEHPHPAELASTLCMPKPTVSVNIKRLEAAGFLKREIDAEDLRRYRLIVTPSGRKALDRGLHLLAQAFGERLGRLSATKQAELKVLLEQMA